MQNGAPAPEPGPAADPSDPVYAWDVSRELAPLDGTEHIHAEATAPRDAVGRAAMRHEHQ